MINRVDSFILQGVDAIPCEIEVDLSPSGLPKTTVVGLPDAAVKESVERVRTALLNSGYRYPKFRITVNLAPADVRKEGPVYDLPMAIALLAADGTVSGPLDDEDGGHDSAAGEDRGRSYLIAGELALDGRVRSVRGVISLAMLARQGGWRGVIVPRPNASEAAIVDGVDVIGVETLADVVAFLNGSLAIEPHPTLNVEAMIASTPPVIDFAAVRGQEAAKRALTIAAAGGHNIVMIGPAGSGKTLLAKALPGILPPLTRDEALEVTRVYSCVGALPADRALICERPVRTPHHTASSAAVIGGGSIPRPGEVSLAHRGVLFLDEMPEFSRNVLETLRQPLEDGCVTIARSHGSVRFPAEIMLVAALNPTPKGDMASDEASHREMERYLARLSGPLVDRIDMHIEAPPVPFAELTASRVGTSTATMRSTVLAARSFAATRQGPRGNASLAHAELDEHAPMTDPARALIADAMTELGLSARAYDKVRRVARTIADMDESATLEVQHVAEAVQYRLLDRAGALSAA